MLTTRLMISSIAVSVSMALAAPVARADDSVRLYVDGECPGAAGLDAALDAEAIAVTTAAAAWTVKVESGDGTSRLTVLHAVHGRVAERATASDDCAAVGEAFALIIKGLLAVPPDAPIVAAAEDAPHPDPPAAGGGSVVALAPPRTTPDIAVEVTPEQAESRPRFSFAVAGGMDFRFDDTRARLVELDVAFPIRRSASVRVVLDVGEHVARVNDFSGVDRRQSALRAEFGTSTERGALWLNIGAGGGVALSTVGASTGDTNPVVSRLHPVLSSTLLLGLRASSSISIRGHIGASLFPVVDRYTTGTMGEIGRSPRASVTIGVGLQFDVGQ